MTPALKKLISEQLEDMASRDRLGLKIVRKILGTAAIPVGFQHRKQISDFETVSVVKIGLKRHAQV